MLFLFRPEKDYSQPYFTADKLKEKLKKLKDSAPMSKHQQDQNTVLVSDLILNPVDRTIFVQNILFFQLNFEQL